MEQNEIIEGNKLIAEFMGFHPVGQKELFFVHDEKINHKWSDDKYDWIDDEYWNVLDFKYHSSWDWLMSACSKWDNLKEGQLSGKNIGEYITLCDELDGFAALYEIKPLFEQLVKCIKWYNQQNQTLNTK